MDEYKLDNTICEHMFEDNGNYYGAVVPPIVQTSLFTFKTYEDFILATNDEENNSIYTRGNNPTTAIFEKKMASLERGESAKAFASGMGAISATLFSLLKKGDHILFLNTIYPPALEYVTLMEKFGVSHNIISVEKEEDIESHIKSSTSIIYLESPSTMKMELLDLRKISYIAKKYNILTMMDNTWSTPIFQKPILHGIDIVVHSCSKYIGGHSDVVAGVVISTEKIVSQIFTQGHQLNGAVIAPFNSWLLLRSLRTLQARLSVHKESTKKIVSFLSKHNKVKKINHPLAYVGRKKDIFNTYFTGYTSLLSFKLCCDDILSVSKFANSLKHFQIGVSWGGFESLVLPQFNGKNEDSLKKRNIDKGLIRLYIGLEDSSILIESLSDALDSI